MTEMKRVWVETSTNFRCYLNDTDSYAPFPKTDLDGTRRTLADMVAADAANLMKWGWTLYDMEEPNVITAWKEI